MTSTDTVSTVSTGTTVSTVSAGTAGAKPSLAPLREKAPHPA